jgi:hypothetical protein
MAASRVFSMNTKCTRAAEMLNTMPAGISVLVFILFSLCFSQTTIPASSRNIQRDGFLLEWDAKNAKSWGSGWSWDAMGTPEGLAGYFTSYVKNHNDKWEFVLESGPGSRFTMLCDTTIPDTSFYRVVFLKKDTISGVVIEWLIPWKLLNVSREKSSAFKLSGHSGGSDTLPAIEIFLKPDTAPRGNLQRRMTIQTALIVILAFALWFLKRRTKAKRRKSPAQ